jgi:hypothetical protein
VWDRWKVGAGLGRRKVGWVDGGWVGSAVGGVGGVGEVVWCGVDGRWGGVGR